MVCPTFFQKKSDIVFFETKGKKIKSKKIISFFSRKKNEKK